MTIRGLLEKNVAERPERNALTWCENKTWMHRSWREYLARVRDVATGCFSPKASAFHYLGMERGHDRAYLHGKTVGAKKYLYTVRALLAARWCLDERTPAPMLLSDLMEAKLPTLMTPVVEDLLAVKAAGKEHQEVAHMPELEVWIKQEDEELYARARADKAPKKVAWEVLDEVFLDILHSGDGS